MEKILHLGTTAFDLARVVSIVELGDSPDDKLKKVEITFTDQSKQIVQLPEGKSLSDFKLDKEETSIDLAYQISKDYFTSSIQRFDAIDSKIQNLFTFVVGVFALAPAIIKSDTKAELTAHFWLGMAFLLLAGLISILARLYGRIRILNPKLISSKQALELNAENFKRSVIDTAGNAYIHNNGVIEIKHIMNVFSMVIFGIALAFLVYWLINYTLKVPLVVQPGFFFSLF